MLLTFDNSYARLPEKFYSNIQPTPVINPQMLCFNNILAEELGLDIESLNSSIGESIFAGNIITEGANPIAMAYAGHQFGHFTRLGDGRAILLGEIIDTKGNRRDVQLKGAGRTPYSRSGDGRAALAPALREYIISEAMHALGIPTTRSLAVVKTGEPVFRENILQGAVLTRVAASHIRIGTFEYFAAQNDIENLKVLADYAINRHYPNIKEASNPYIELLESVAQSQASLIAKWMLVGFIHGVMNTDNMTISGETIDYGPCAFMDIYNPQTVFSFIDKSGRYAYGNQPSIAQWNIARFAETLLPLLNPNQEDAVVIAEEIINKFTENFELHWLDGIRKKLGLFTVEPDDISLIQSFLSIMQKERDDYTNSFYMLSSVVKGEELKASYNEWVMKWKNRQAKEAKSQNEILNLMQANNPAFISRNHLVEEALSAAEQSDLSKLEKLLTILAKPFDYKPEYSEYQNLPEPSERVYQTFCGT
jgi:uncharacterized protein YdiU (UPF0061 family)